MLSKEVGVTVTVPILPKYILEQMMESGVDQPQFPVSDYPEEFLFALQLEQARFSRLGSIGRLQMLKQIIGTLSELLESSNSQDEPERPNRIYQKLTKNFPIVELADGYYIPTEGGWILRNNPSKIPLESGRGRAIWQAALEQSSFLEQCLIRLLQSEPKQLSQAEFDILYAFELIDFRVIFSKEERERRIKAGRLNSEQPTDTE